jgi:hypothetical protein
MSSSSTTTRYVPAGSGRSISGKTNALENVSVVSLLRVVIAASQCFRFGVAAAADGFAAKGEAGAATAGFAALGLRVSRLPRRFSLAIFLSFWRVVWRPQSDHALAAEIGPARHPQ